jgi:hypothetical protein
MRRVERILAFYRSTSSPVAAVALVVANLIPLVGVLAFGWDLLTILVIYWLENGVVGVYNVLRMATAQGSGQVSVDRTVAKVIAIPIFCLHYSVFWVVHGVFVFALPSFAGAINERMGFGQGVDPGPLVGTVVVLAISHGLSYWLNFIRAGEYRRVSAPELMMAPYGRLVVLHVTIILGAFAIAATGTPVAALVILVTLKTLLDLGFHLGEHRRLGARPVAGPR